MAEARIIELGFRFLAKKSRKQIRQKQGDDNALHEISMNCPNIRDRRSHI